ncbi:uncharacterized protein [Rutidosis leptorrhynchoides]|uniref:uncharacterized protein n=1 Tax=Rutidosis leptorrhynchoides TaxID=125765 RepID=UPI003A996874
MAIRDQDKTAFHTPNGIFCYIMMPFGLKNTGATYQRVIDKVFKNQIGRNVEAYVDDIVVKSHTEDKEAEKAFQDIKRLLKELPTLTAPIEGETLILYLAASAEAISSVLIAERKGVQMPIYFVSKILQQSEVNYLPIEKLVYALTHTARWLRRYFQAHSILVLTDQPIKHILRNPELSGRLAKWLKVKFWQIFLLETTEKVDHLQNVKGSNYVWELHTDGASSEEGVGAGLVLTSPEGEEHTYALSFCFYASNNEAEYEALLFGLRIAFEMGIKHLHAYVDSQIVAQQVNGGFEAKDVSMKQYLQLVEKISKTFETLEVVQIPRNKNKKADVLGKLAVLTFDHLHKKVLVEVLKEKSVDEKVVIATVEEGESCWITPYVKYLQDETLPTDAIDARRIRVSTPLYILENEVLYRKSFSGPNLRCLTPQQAINVVKEMHEGLCT